METLIGSNDVNSRIVINVAELVGVDDGDNPHVWYDPKTMPALAVALAEALIAADPEGRADFEARRDAFLAALAPIDTEVAALRGRFEGTPVAATEPVFGYMADALGLTMTNEAFQTAIMNESEPAASDIAAMEDDIRSGRVKVLFYNAQVEDAFTRNLADLADPSGVPVVGVTETQPEGKTFAEWMLDTIGATGKALGDPSS
jgi:zinc/manganese transport system substrate-binding protein